MWKVVFNRLRKIFSNSGGSVSLEAVIIFPLILFILFSLIFLAMFVYQKLVLLDAAVYTARQRAATWDNSSKNLEDGFQAKPSSDGLYWRIFNDSRGSALVENKLREAVDFLNRKLSSGVFKLRGSGVDVQYTNELIERTVAVKVTQDLIIPVRWPAGILGNNLTAGAKAVITEPVEYIRNISLAEKNAGGKRSGPVIASKESNSNGIKIYHYPDCPYVQRIKEANRIEFDTPQSALSKGYHLCQHCAGNAAKP